MIKTFAPLSRWPETESSWEDFPPPGTAQEQYHAQRELRAMQTLNSEILSVQTTRAFEYVAHDGRRVIQEPTVILARDSQEAHQRAGIDFGIRHPQQGTREVTLEVRPFASR